MRWCCLCVLGLLCACAQNPDKVQAEYVSPLIYQNLDCEQIEMELMRVSREVSAVSGRQRDERTKDQIATGVGLVVFWPALFFLAKGDEKDRLARLKGEYEALEHVSLQQKCNIFPPT